MISENNSSYCSNDNYVKHVYIDFSLSDSNMVLHLEKPLYGHTYESVVAAHQASDMHLIEFSHIPPNRRIRKTKYFPVWLHEILHSPISEGVIQWMNHGRSFSIVDRYRFIETISPYSGKTIKLKSFMRQLQLYGFKRLHDGSYYHQCFLRGFPELVYRMEPSPIKGKSGKRLKEDPSNEPNFEEFAVCSPLLYGKKKLAEL